MVEAWAECEAILQRLERGFRVLDSECWIRGLEGKISMDWDPTTFGAVRCSTWGFSD